MGFYLRVIDLESSKQLRDFVSILGSAAPLARGVFLFASLEELKLFLHINFYPAVLFWPCFRDISMGFYLRVIDLESSKQLRDFVSILGSAAQMARGVFLFASLEELKLFLHINFYPAVLFNCFLAGVHWSL